VRWYRLWHPWIFYVAWFVGLAFTSATLIITRDRHDYSRSRALARKAMAVTIFAGLLSLPEALFLWHPGPTLRITRISDGKMTIVGKARIDAIAFSPDGTIVVTAGMEPGYVPERWYSVINAWRVSDGQKMWRRTQIRTNRGDCQVTFMPGGGRIAWSTSSGATVLLHASTGIPVHNTVSHSYGYMALSPDGAVFASNRYGYLEVRRIADNHLLWSVPCIQPETWPDRPTATFSPDGKLIACMESMRTVVVRDVKSGGKIAALTGKPDPAALRFVSKTQVMAFADGVIERWDISGGSRPHVVRIMRIMKHGGWNRIPGGNLASISSDGIYALIVDNTPARAYSGVLWVIDTATGRHPHTLWNATRAEFSPDGRSVAYAHMYPSPGM
jgi:WD40 repeat protein